MAIRTRGHIGEARGRAALLAAGAAYGHCSAAGVRVQEFRTIGHHVMLTLAQEFRTIGCNVTPTLPRGCASL
jgi:hypothetical protein